MIPVAQQSRSKPREPYRTYLPKFIGALTGAALLWAVGYCEGRFYVGIDPQLQTCLLGNHHVFVVDRWDRVVIRGGLYAFAVRGIEPYYPDGTLLAKRAAGIPGDVVSISAADTRVNGLIVGHDLLVARSKQWPLGRFIRTLTVPSHFYFFMGENDLSFDSRYWGPVAESLIMGRVYVLW